MAAFRAGAGGVGMSQGMGTAAATKRIQRELKEIHTTPSRHWTAAPVGDDLFEWQFAVRGPPGTDFEGGIYTGRIVLPAGRARVWRGRLRLKTTPRGAPAGQLVAGSEGGRQALVAGSEGHEDLAGKAKVQKRTLEPDIDDEPLSVLVKPLLAQVQNFYDWIDAGPRRSDGWRARESEARLAAKSAAAIADRGRARDEQHGRRVSARIQRGVGPQLCIPDDTDGRAEAVRHQPQWPGEAAKYKYGYDRCGAKARTPEDLSSGFCRGQPKAVEDAHPTYQLMISAALLRDEYTGVPSNENSRTRRNNMRKGKDPVKLQFWGDPVRVVRETDPLEQRLSGDLGARAVHTVGSALEANLAEVHDDCDVLEEPDGSDELEMSTGCGGVASFGELMGPGCALSVAPVCRRYCVGDLYAVKGHWLADICATEMRPPWDAPGGRRRGRARARSADRPRRLPDGPPGGAARLAPQTLLEGGALLHPQGVAVDQKHKRLVVADPDNQTIWSYRLEVDGGRLHAVTPPDRVVRGLESRWVAVDTNGNVLFSDEAESQIWRIAWAPPEQRRSGEQGGEASRFGTSSGVVVKASEVPLPEPREEESVVVLGKNAQKCYGVCLALNNVFYTDSSHNLYGVKKSGGDVAVVSSGLSKPRGCAYDKDGSVYVADRGAGAVYYFPGNMVVLGSSDLVKAFDLDDAFGLTFLAHSESSSVGETVSSAFGVVFG
ncbi:unnamed protein product [Prorocentrum cordatum]|uniref:UBC core domain-containing protein n=1 Tax=Prorocentrum cordatum TaxID=2364126 RepID=A0ABN9RLF7_9DINO|nr:unnamed protein product [Polarella glacialis]